MFRYAPRITLLAGRRATTALFTSTSRSLKVIPEAIQLKTDDTSKEEVANKAQEKISEMQEDDKPLLNKDGAIGKEFRKEGAIGSIGEKIGGPFASDGAVGKNFNPDGAVGETVHEELGKKK